jgi:hypothetical protein
MGRKVKEFLGGLGLVATQLVNQGFAGRAREESTDSVSVNDIGKVIDALGKAPDVGTEGLLLRLRTTLEIPRVAWSGVGALEIADEYLPELSPIADAIGREILKPGSRGVSQEDWEILNDEIVVNSATSSASEAIVLQPDPGVRLPRILGEAVGRSKARREWSVADISSKGLRPGCLRAQATRTMTVAVISTVATVGVVTAGRLIPTPAASRVDDAAHVMCITGVVTRQGSGRSLGLTAAPSCW